MSGPKLATQTIDRNSEITLWKELLQVNTSGGPLSMIRKHPQKISGAAVLLVHGFAQNRYAWHLPQRSFVNYLVSNGYDVFNLELRGHGRSRALGSSIPTTFNEYAFEDFPAAVHAALRVSGQKKLFVIGHSLGGSVAYAAAPSLTSQLRGIVTLGGVFHLGRGLPMFKALGAALRVFLKSTPLPLMTFRSGLIAKVLSLPIAEPLLSMTRLLPWESGSIERPILEEYLRRSFDRTSFQVIADLFDWMHHDQFGGQSQLTSSFLALTLPLLVIAADHDHFNNSAGIKPAYDGSMSPDKTYLELSPENAGGHYGHADMIIGSKAPLFVWPLIQKWLEVR
jgi:polyhydroxyalkanoate synthase subunit PhaC